MHRARGFGLIEVLITLLVFSIGVLAVAGLQVISKKNNYNALQRNTAAHLAQSIAASMRANPNALSGYLIAENSPRGSRGTITPPETNCYLAACTPQELATFDLWQWELSMNGASEIGGADDDRQTGGLTAPSACIDGPAGGGAGVYRITLAWRGVTQLEQNTPRTCGTGRGLYGAPADTTGGTADESYQRSFTLETYISP